jgi:hypothetical protein
LARRSIALMISTTSETSSSSNVEAAASVGFTRSSASSHICLGRVVVRPPVTKSASVSSSKEVMKAKRKADNSPALICGSVIRISVVSRGARLQQPAT